MMPFDVEQYAFCVVSLSASLFVLVPLTWHWQARNSSTCFYMIWTSVACMNSFVNAVLWAEDAIDRAPVWCDMSTRITIGASVGIPAASLCISRRLYRIAAIQAATLTRAEKIRDVFFDSLLCVGFPIVCMALAYIVQGHRYDILGSIGCYPATYNTLPAYFLVFMWPLVIGLISATYCLMSLRHLIYRQVQFRQFLAAGSSLTASRYVRLMALAVTEVILTVPFAIYEICANAAGGVQPWRGWADTHYDFSRVDQFPSMQWRAVPSAAIPIEIARWIIPFCAVVFLAYFGFAEEARRRYGEAFFWVVSRLRCLPSLSSLRRRGSVSPQSFEPLSSFTGSALSASVVKTDMKVSVTAAVPKDILDQSDVSAVLYFEKPLSSPPSCESFGSIV